MKLIDLTGQVFGRLTVVDFVPNKKPIHWVCLCECGTKKIVSAANLKSGGTKSCGCYNREISSSSKLKDLSGQKYGRLTAVKRVPGGSKSVKWECLCECGKQVKVRTTTLINGQSKSCGCLRAELKTIHQTKNLLGQTFGLLRVLRGPLKVNGETAWECSCSCGNQTTVKSRHLKGNPGTRSCGCLARVTGSKRWSWRAALTDEYRDKRRLRHIKAYRLGFSQKVLARDSHTCFHCGHEKTRLAVHHIMPWAAYPKLRYATENCITLCKDCHNEFHSMYGREDFDDEDLKDYLT